MANFPAPPHTVDDTHEEGGVSWVFDGDKWVKQSPLVTTADVTLFDPTNPATTVASPFSIPDVPVDTTSQYDVNRWFVNALNALDSGTSDDGTYEATFFSYYQVVHPDNYVGAPGTVSVKTNAYGDPNVDQFASPTIVEFEFSNLDIFGKGFPQTMHEAEDDFFFDFVTNNVDPGQMNSIPSGTFKVTARKGYRKYEGNIHMGQFWTVHEGDYLAVRTPSVFNSLNQQNDIHALEGTVETALEAQADLTQRVSDGETKQEVLEGGLETTIESLGALEGTVDDAIIAQNNIKTEIETLENKIAALEGAVLDATYILSSRAVPRIGEFQIYNTGDASSQTSTWADVNYISLHSTDSNNNPHTFEAVQLDDLIRLASVGGAAVYKVKSLRIEDGDVWGFEVEVVSQTGAPAESLQYDFEVTPAFDASAYVTKSYVDSQDELKYDKTGGDITGTVRINSQTNNDDSLRFYMRDSAGVNNISMFPSGLIESNNVFRIKKDTGDGFQIKDSSGSTVVWKATATGETQTHKITLSGGNSAVDTERVIDVKSGVAGRLSYNNETKMSWSSSKIWIGRSGTLGEDETAVTLDLQSNDIINVGALTIKAGDEALGNHRTFTIKGTLADGVTNDSSDFFYAYSDVGAADAINYKGKIESPQNITTKQYVDDKFDSVNVDTSALMPKSGGTFTGKVTLNNSGNDQINFGKSGNSNIQYKNSWIVSFQGDASPLVKMNTYIHMNTNRITNLGNPAGDMDAVNKRSLKGARVTETSSSNTSNGGFYENGGRLFYKLQ